MHPEWQTVNRLLVLYPEDTATIAALIPTLNILRDVLSHGRITVVTGDRIQHPLLLSQFDCVSLRDWCVDDDIVHRSSSDISRLIFKSGASDFLDLVSSSIGKSLILSIAHHQFNAAFVFTNPSHSPYLWGYLCYLAGIPIRVGQSQEFGGGVLSHWVQPSVDPVGLEQYYLHLVEATGVVAQSLSQSKQQSIAYTA